MCAIKNKKVNQEGRRYGIQEIREAKDIPGMIAEGSSRMSAVLNAWREASPDQSKRIKDSWRDAFWKKMELNICLKWTYWEVFFSSDKEFVTEWKKEKGNKKCRQLLTPGKTKKYVRKKI